MFRDNYVCRVATTRLAEGAVSLVDALDLKIQKAAQEGIIYLPLARRFSG